MYGDILKDRRIVLGVCGGIAAYKSVELVRLLTVAGARVRVIMTQHARWFVGPTTFGALTGEPVYDQLFQENRDASIRHIEWAENADAVIIAPATANIIGKMANGIADDALSTFLLAVTAPILVCPSMNTHMYENHAVQRNLGVLKTDGCHILAPASGQLACGAFGAGRLPEPAEICDRTVALLSRKDLFGKTVLVTAGPTREAIDPVRFISNPSSGKMGYAIARAAEYRGARVILVSGPVALADPLNVSVERVQSALQMADAVFSHLDEAHIVIKAAAVGDYRPEQAAGHKIKKHNDRMSLNLVQNPDILKEIGREKGGRFLVGFAAETRDLEANSLKKISQKNLDMIVGNLVSRPDSGFSTDANQAVFFYSDGSREEFPLMDKFLLANALLDRVVARMAG